MAVSALFGDFNGGVGRCDDIVQMDMRYENMVRR